ncbi:MmcQ/YjbR family DNA-binding protein [Thalassobaculum sp. OXR-137]|uniref:MmcQ/YjbR family DNA-binding protein n=1 Tax=Thalassobaculum sp. OXR-137 TaxID=3100173 RepID=UPI002AC91751|nr:MmcQ/YjbR family DNA-binding protein [Thalassobaculum sp. OXR-137]WPZ35486.1 MmcQ/YjbR family DNA-binding protein [Thalassobaculum sp. OXR-137]
MFDAYCAALPAAFHVVQWGGATVWKVGDGNQSKVFAIAGWGDGSRPAYTFKVSPVAYEMLREEPGLRPAPYLASRGMKWIQQYADPGLSDENLKAYLAESHRLAARNLTKKQRIALGLP